MFVDLLSQVRGSKAVYKGPKYILGCTLRSAEQSGKPTEFQQMLGLTGIAREHLLQSHLLLIILGGL